ncbi:hypothetical protein [Chryseobacterium sp.]|uniref:hypothetical protein n=1 Tax=Chryseobacterium sp. TaxID=1871047 RepID=UPI00289967C8|nr:hypothetical protein [Chryseobacterium sp.]
MRIKNKVVSKSENFGLLLFVLVSFQLKAQTDQELVNGYRNVIIQSDSLLKIGKISNFNKEEVISLARKLDSQYPLQYLSNSLKYLNQKKYNESAFLYFLGKIRKKELDKSNGFNNYDGVGGDADNFINEVVVTYLASDGDNYKNILKKVITYYERNSYTYLKNNKSKKPSEELNEYKKIIDRIESEPEKSKQDLKEFRDDMATKIKEYFFQQ